MDSKAKLVVDTDPWGLFNNIEVSTCIELFGNLYRWGLDPCSIKPDKVDEFMAAVKEQFSGPEDKIYDFQESHARLIAMSPVHVLFYKTTAKEVVFAARNDLDSLNELISPFNDFIDTDDEEGRDVSCYYLSGNGAVQSTYVKARVAEAIESLVPELYTTIDIKILVDSFLASDSKILFLYGPPGTGKTTLLKYLTGLTSISNIAYCKDLHCLERNSTWLTMQTAAHDVLLLDDLDAELCQREKNDSDIVSNLLTFSDGVLTNDTKIIITTNMPIKSIDGALMRAGRCYDIIKFEPLTYKEAKDLWVDVLKVKLSDFDRLFNSEDNHEISQAALMEAYKLVINATAFRPYIKKGESTYSIESKALSMGISVNSNYKYFGEGSK